MRGNNARAFWGGLAMTGLLAELADNLRTIAALAESADDHRVAIARIARAGMAAARLGSFRGTKKSRLSRAIKDCSEGGSK